jgi:hypothetical protein
VDEISVIFDIKSIDEETADFLRVSQRFSDVKFIAALKSETEFIFKENPHFKLLFSCGVFLSIYEDGFLRTDDHKFRPSERKIFAHFLKRNLFFHCRPDFSSVVCLVQIYHIRRERRELSWMKLNRF